jgi:hypothetical protein
MTRTRPLCGSSATAEPHTLSSSSVARRWASASIVRTSELPSCVSPRTLSRVRSTIVLRFEFEPVRKSFIDFSRPARERVTVE